MRSGGVIPRTSFFVETPPEIASGIRTRPTRSSVASSHRRIVASSHRRIVASSHRRIVLLGGVARGFKVKPPVAAHGSCCSRKSVGGSPDAVWGSRKMADGSVKAVSGSLEMAGGSGETVSCPPKAAGRSPGAVSGSRKMAGGSPETISCVLKMAVSAHPAADLLWEHRFHSHAEASTKSTKAH